MQDPFESPSAPRASLRESLRILFLHRTVPRLGAFERLLVFFSPAERLLLYILITLMALSSLALMAYANFAISTEIPARGGSLSEGVVGPVRFINPVLAISSADRDLTTLVYAGLMRATPEGDLIPDAAESFEIAEDGTTYTFVLREGLTFHDGEPLTAQDVVFTIALAQNPDVKSPRRADWEGVSVEAVGDRTVIMHLPHAYAPFLENTTMGILPKHRFENTDAAELPFSPNNTHPVGSGPFSVETVETNEKTGTITRYELAAFEQFSLGAPYLSKLNFRVYANEEALLTAFEKGAVESLGGISPAHLPFERETRMLTVSLPRTFGVFFNQNKQPLFADPAVREALEVALEKEALVDTVLRGFGSVMKSPIPPRVLEEKALSLPMPLELPSPFERTRDTLAEARAVLEKGGWSWNEAEGAWKKKDVVLSFSLATIDEPTLATTTEEIARAWRALGVQVETKVYPVSEFNTLVLRPRAYEAIFFGEAVGRTLDLFAFWHSSQRNDPGLNIAMYTNVKADALLSKARAETSSKDRAALYRDFENIVIEDRPAIFLFAPHFIYLVPEKLRGVRLGILAHPADRLLEAYRWHIDTERVWNIFVP